MPSIITFPSRSARCAWMMVTSGRSAGMHASSSPVKGRNETYLAIHRRQVGTAIPAEEGAGHSGGAGLIGMRHGGMAVFDDFERRRPRALHRVPQPVERTDPRVSAPGKYQLAGRSHADHLVVDEVRGHAYEG